jgi:phage-related protein
MKRIVFMGRSLDELRDFPSPAKRDAGYQLDRVQRGFDPVDWKPMSTIGQGVREIRIKQEGQFRVIYIAKFEDTIYVLHAFQKKTQQTRQHDINVAKQALKDILARQQS